MGMQLYGAGAAGAKGDTGDTGAANNLAIASYALAADSTAAVVGTWTQLLGCSLTITVGPSGKVLLIARGSGTTTSGTGVILRTRVRCVVSGSTVATDFYNAGTSTSVAGAFSGLTPAASATIVLEYWLTSTGGTPVVSFRQATTASDPTATSESFSMTLESP